MSERDEQLLEKQKQAARDAMIESVALTIRQAAASWLVGGITPGAIAAGCVSAAIDVMVAKEMTPMQISNALYDLCDRAREQAFSKTKPKH